MRVKYIIHKITAEVHFKLGDYHFRKGQKWYDYVHNEDWKNAVCLYIKNDVKATQEILSTKGE